MKKFITHLKITGYLVICLGILFIAIPGNGCGSKKNRPNIIILLLDCVRADHLSCYGYSRNTSPHIDALAAQGVKFNRAISQSPWTLTSVTSLLTGCYPHHHGVGLSSKKGRSLDREHKTIKIPGPNIPVLPEQLQQAGYKTWGFSTNFFVNNENIGKRGFDELKYLIKAPAEQVVDYGLKKIAIAKDSGKPFFLYLHFMDAHEPLVPPEKYYNYFPTSDGKGNEKIHEKWSFCKYENQNGNAFENFKEHKLSLYDGAIRYQDAEICRLIKFLKSSKLITGKNFGTMLLLSLTITMIPVTYPV
jgi:arylsulfatase A-like enzyme